MSADTSFTPDYRPTVAIFSEPGGLSVSLVEKLLANFCKVALVSDDIKGWEEVTAHITQKNFLEIAPVEVSPEYIVFIDIDLAKKTSDYEKLIRLYSKSAAKVLVILPYSFSIQNSVRVATIQESLKEAGSDFGAIYLGDLVGPRITEHESYLVRVLMEGLTRNTFPLLDGNYFPLSISDAGREIAKSLFSFGPYGDSLAIIGEGVSGTHVFERARNILGQIGHSSKVEKRREAPASKKLVRQVNLEQGIKETVEWIKTTPQKRKFITAFKKTPDFQSGDELNADMSSSLRGSPAIYGGEDVIKEEKKAKKELQPPFISKKLVFRSFLLLFGFFLLPYVFISISALSLVTALQFIGNAKIEAAGYAFSAGRVSGDIASGQFTLYSKIPLVGEVFISSKNLSGLLKKGSSLGERGMTTIKEAALLISKVLGEKVYDPYALSQNLALDLDYLYKESGFLLTEVEGGGGIFTNFIKDRSFYKKIPEVRENVLQAKRIISEFPALTGVEKPTSYLILFQNNMELRPTGGFIGSFALASFGGGRLTDMQVSDVYAADGQLKGHVEPPAPIKNYLGEANWYLRDSNWDADFPTSASRAEWFLDKEIDQSVDGVVGVDLEFAKNILKIVGPIDLADFNEVVDYKNLYEKTQRQVESDFFPGSYKKTSFLTALSKQLLTRVSEAKENEFLPLALKVLESLETRHVQVFLHNKSAQVAVSSMGFEGAVNQPSCLENCYADWFGVVEANVGVNKANYFLERELSFSGYLDNQNLKRFLTVRLKNSANPALGEAGKYKTYLRLMLPISASVNDALVTSGGFDEAQIPEIEEKNGRKEAGILIEIGPGQTKEVTFSWQEEIGLDFSKEGEYRLYVRKQAGTLEDKIAVILYLPQGIKIGSQPLYSLTRDGGYGYNTILTRDLFSRISW